MRFPFSVFFFAFIFDGFWLPGCSDGTALAANFEKRKAEGRVLHLSRSELYLQGHAAHLQLADRVKQMDRVDRDSTEVERQLRAIKHEADTVINKLRVHHELDESIEILDDDDVHSHRTRADSEFYGRYPASMPPPLGQEKIVWDAVLELGPAMQMSLFKRLRLHLIQMQMIDEPVTRSVSNVDLASLEQAASPRSSLNGTPRSTAVAALAADARRSLTRSADQHRAAVVPAAAATGAAAPKPPPLAQLSSSLRGKRDKDVFVVEDDSDDAAQALMSALRDAERKMDMRRSPRRAVSPDGRRRNSNRRARSRSPPPHDALVASPMSSSARRPVSPRGRRELSPRARTHREFSPRRGRPDASSSQSPRALSPRALSPRRRREPSPSPRHPSGRAPSSSPRVPAPRLSAPGGAVTPAIAAAVAAADLRASPGLRGSGGANPSSDKR